MCIRNPNTEVVTYICLNYHRYGMCEGDPYKESSITAFIKRTLQKARMKSSATTPNITAPEAAQTRLGKSATWPKLRKQLNPLRGIRKALRRSKTAPSVKDLDEKAIKEWRDGEIMEQPVVGQGITTQAQSSQPHLIGRHDSATSSYHPKPSPPRATSPEAVIYGRLSFSSSRYTDDDDDTTSFNESYDIRPESDDQPHQDYYPTNLALAQLLVGNPYDDKPANTWTYPDTAPIISLLAQPAETLSACSVTSASIKSNSSGSSSADTYSPFPTEAQTNIYTYHRAVLDQLGLQLCSRYTENCNLRKSISEATMQLKDARQRLQKRNWWEEEWGRVGMERARRRWRRGVRKGREVRVRVEREDGYADGWLTRWDWRERHPCALRYIYGV